MAAGGATTGEIATIVSATALPWTLKLANGFIIDRYTFLPMGRRRVWIVGAQTLLVVVLVAGALASPEPDEILLLAGIAFIANVAVTFQDVGIDSLAVDIMEEDERARAGGIMFGSQIIGIAATTAVAGALLEAFGIGPALFVAALVPAAVALFGASIREREGERRLPWTAGTSHPHNLAIQVEAWWPLLANATRAVLLPLSLVLLPILLFRALPAGAFESFHPQLFQNGAGWALSEYTNFISSVGFATGLLGLVVGGWLVDAVGSQRSVRIAVVAGAILLAAMGFASAYWTQSWLLMGFVILFDICGLMFAIAMIPICMRMCDPATAATQFTIYMAIGNFGRPLGAALAANTAGAGSPEWLYWSIAIAWALIAAILFAVRFPESAREGVAKVQVEPLGTGLHPLED